MKKAICGFIAAAAAFWGLAVPADAAVVGTVSAIQRYNYPYIQIGPVPVGSTIFLSANVVVGAKLETMNCVFQGGATEGVVAALPFGRMDGQCVTPSVTLDCSFDYSRVAVLTEWNGNCGTLAFLGELEWVGLPNTDEAALSGFIQIG